MALLLGVGHPGRTSERLTTPAGPSAVHGASDYADLGDIQVSAFGHTVAQRKVGVTAREIGRFPRFD